MSDSAASERGSVRVVGTAHVSHESVEEVERVIEEERPDVVAVELDEGRYRQMKGEAPDDIDPKDLLRGSMAFQFLAYWLLSYVQTRLGERFDIQPGADMLAAVETAEDLDIDVALVDRNIQVTIQRFWTRMGLVEKLRLVGGLLLGVADGYTIGGAFGGFAGLLVGVAAEAVAGPFFLVPPAFTSTLLTGVISLLAGVVEVVAFAAAGGLLGAVVLGTVLRFTEPEGTDVEELDMEELMDQDVVSVMMDEFRRFSPNGAEALIDERDAYLAHNIHALREQGKDVVAIIGAGHREGVEAYLENPGTLPPMESLTGRAEKRFSLFKAIGALITVGFLVFFALLIMAGVSNLVLLKVFAAWFLFNGIFAGGLAYAAGARPISALVGGAVAWLTSLNPLLAPGWFAGYVELRYTKVSISDISTLNALLSDETRPVSEIFGDMLDVPLFKLIAIVAVTNLGSFIASIFFPFVVLPFVSGFDSVDAVTAAMRTGIQNSIDVITSLL